MQKKFLLNKKLRTTASISEIPYLSSFMNSIEERVKEKKDLVNIDSCFKFVFNSHISFHPSIEPLKVI